MWAKQLIGGFNVVINSRNGLEIFLRGMLDFGWKPTVDTSGLVACFLAALRISEGVTSGNGGGGKGGQGWC